MDRRKTVLLITTVFFWASEYCHVPYFTPYLSSLGIGAAVMGVLVGCYGFVQTVVRIPLGIYTDATSGYKKVIIFGALCTTLSSWGLYVTKNAFLILLCRALAGMAASTWIAFTVMYSGYFSDEEGFKAMGQINGANNMGKALAFALGTVTAALYTLREPLLMSVITGVLAIAFSLFIEDVQIKKEPLDIKRLKSSLTDKSVIIPAVMALFLMMAVHATVFSFTSSAAAAIGASNLQIGISTSIFTAVQVISSFFIGKAKFKGMKERHILFAGFLLIALYCFMVGYANNIYIIYAAQIICGFANIVVMSLVQSACIRNCAPGQKATCMGIFQAIYGIGMTVGPIFMGTIVDLTNFKTGYTVFFVILLVISAISYFVMPAANKKC